MARKIEFSQSRPSGDRVYHVNEDDLRVVLSRLPEECYSRLRRVHFNDRARGNRVAGYVTPNHKEIALCALPPRMSLTPFLVKGQKPESFGAVRGAQWPATAIRRFLMYNVFLHEVGHLQIIDPTSKSWKKKFAREPKAQEFAMRWNKILWSEYYDHTDPAHNPPSKSEIAALKQQLSLV